MVLLLTLLEGSEFLGAPIFDADDFWRLLLKTFFNLIVVLILARGIYYPLTKNKDYLFTYLLISLTVFVLCVLPISDDGDGLNSNNLLFCI